MTQTETKTMPRALLVIDVQVDFIEGGALGVTGGAQVSQDIARYLSGLQDETYRLVIASKDWHAPAPHDNCGHFALDGQPDFTTSWPVHCEADSLGADFAPALDGVEFDEVVRKGYGAQSYSAFEGVTASGQSLLTILRSAGITELDICGIATDYCVLASVKDALGTGFRVNVITDLIAGVAPDSSAAALRAMQDAGAGTLTSDW